MHGDFLNVVGFPLNHFCKQLGKIYNRSAESPANKIKQNDLAMCDGPCAAVNCLSVKNVQADISSFNSSDSFGSEGTKSNNEDFPHNIVELLDGFKASKVKNAFMFVIKWPEVINEIHLRVACLKDSKMFLS